MDPSDIDSRNSGVELEPRMVNLIFSVRTRRVSERAFAANGVYQIRASRSEHRGCRAEKAIFFS